MCPFIRSKHHKHTCTHTHTHKKKQQQHTNKQKKGAHTHTHTHKKAHTHTQIHTLAHPVSQSPEIKMPIKNWYLTNQPNWPDNAAGKFRIYCWCRLVSIIVDVCLSPNPQRQQKTRTFQCALVPVNTFCIIDFRKRRNLKASWPRRLNFHVPKLDFVVVDEIWTSSPVVLFIAYITVNRCNSRAAAKYMSGGYLPSSFLFSIHRLRWKNRCVWSAFRTIRST